MDEINRFDGDYRFLSNFYPSYVKYEGIVYPTVEHGFQAAKATLESDRLRIANATTAARAKRMGRTVTLREDWEEVKQTVMLNLLRNKFAIPDLRVRLLSTGDAKLIEGNYWGDRYWGVCDGHGLNVLGILLMKVRDEIGGSDGL